MSATKAKNAAILLDIENDVSYQAVCRAIKAARKEQCQAFIVSDWTHNRLKKNPWKDLLTRTDINRIKVGKHSTNKNALDHALFTAAEVLAQSGTELFIVLSNDTDFRKIINHLHELQCKVIGIGNERTSKKLITEYDTYLHCNRTN